MDKPHQILGIAASAAPEEIRRRYLELVRQHPPDRDPQRFAEIRRAYDELSDPIRQVENMLFDIHSVDSIDSIMSSLQTELRQRRIRTDVLLSLAKD